MGQAIQAQNLPLFPVPANQQFKPFEETVRDLSDRCHVVEVKGDYALVHASPIGIARVAEELRLPIFRSKRGGEYYAVRVRAYNAGQEPAQAPRSEARRSVHPTVQVQPSRPVQVQPGTVRLEIRDNDYLVTETPTKRRIDLRRWEVRKLGDEITPPYVVTFQTATGSEAQCDCKDWIYRRRQCKHITALAQAFGSNRARQSFAS